MLHKLPLELPDSGMETPDKPRSSSKLAWMLSIVYILYSLEVGIFLISLPWLEIWDNNYLTFHLPVLRRVIINPFLKGAVLGLGIVNLFIGFKEIANLRNGPRNYFSR